MAPNTKFSANLGQTSSPLSLTVVALLMVFVAGCIAPIPVPDTAQTADVAGQAEYHNNADTEDGPDTVAIFVVDKFASIGSQESASATEQPEADPNTYPFGEGCIIDPDGSGYRSGGTGGAEHGRLVWSTITEDLETKRAHLVNGPANGDLWETYATPELVDKKKEVGDYDMLSQKWEVPCAGYIRLIPIDIGDFDTATVTYKIKEGFELLEKYRETSGENISDVVINMSWVILPEGACSIPTDPVAYRDMICEIAKADDATEQELLNDIKATLDELGLESKTVQNVCDENLFTYDMVKSDSLKFLLRRYFAELADARPDAKYFEETKGELSSLLSQLNREAHRKATNVINIAAAGNQGWDFPLMPALWDSVVSVSAEEGIKFNSDSCDPESEFCSNSAEIMNSGMHPYSNELTSGDPAVCPPGFDCSLYANQTDVVGSSYAAPRLSVLASLFLLSDDGANPCMTAPTIRPPLGYDDWKNMPVEEARDLYCTEFPTQ